MRKNCNNCKYKTMLDNINNNLINDIKSIDSKVENNSKKIERLKEKIENNKNNLVSDEDAEYAYNLNREVDKLDISRSAIALNIRQALHFILGSVIIIILFFIIATVLMAVKQKQYKFLVLLVPELIIGALVVIFYKGIDELNKSDLYNMLMLILGLISLVIAMLTIA